MRCNIRVEFIDESGARAEVVAFSLERPTLITQAEVGLAHSEGKRLLLAAPQEALAPLRYAAACSGSAEPHPSAARRI
jgi:hypothetical protein